MIKAAKEYIPEKNGSTNRAYIFQLKKNKYAALKPVKNELLVLEKLLKSFSHKELKEYILNRIISNDLNDINNKNDSNR